MKETSPGRVHLGVDEARELCNGALMSAGLAADDARIITEHLVDAAVCGYEYSGLPKLLNLVEHWRHKLPRQPVKPIRETPVSVLLDGGNNNGMLALYHATQAAIAKASGLGVGIVGITNSWMSGRSAHYMEMVARAGLVGIHTVSSTLWCAPPGGAKRALGTNPIAMAFPTEGDPLVIDVATSAFPGTDLQFRVRTGEALPPGVAIDAEGRETTDPHAAIQGSLHLAGYKGFAMALGFQALGVMAGSGMDIEKHFGYLIIAMKPDLLVPEADLRKGVSDLIARVKATPKLPGFDEIRIPSERSFRERRERLVEGIEIDRIIYERIDAVRRRA